MGTATHLGVLNIKKMDTTLLGGRPTSMAMLLQNVGTTAEICSAHRTGEAYGESRSLVGWLLAGCREGTEPSHHHFRRY
jgi:hypothetical protein